MRTQKSKSAKRRKRIKTQRRILAKRVRARGRKTNLSYILTEKPLFFLELAYVGLYFLQPTTKKRGLTGTFGKTLVSHRKQAN